MSYHVSTTELENAIGAATENALNDATAAVIDQIITQASALVDAALDNAGYTPPSTTKSDPSAAPDLVKMATIGAILPLLYGRKGEAIPETLYAIFGGTLNNIADGTVSVYGLTASSREATGGVRFSNSSATSTGGRPRIFGTLRDDY